MTPRPNRDTAALDATGLGAPAVEIIQPHVNGTALVPVTITSGTPRWNGPHLYIGKQKLIAGLVQAIGIGRLLLAQDCACREDLREELSRFIATPTRRGWKLSGKATGKDDLLLCSSLAVLAARLHRSD